MSRPAALAALARSSTGIALDALLEGRAGTLPLQTETATTPAFLNGLLAAHGTHPAARAARAGAVEVLAAKPVSSNCENVLLRPRWESGDGMPETLFMKIPGKPLGTRWFCNVLGVWELECAFFRGFGADFPLRLPRVHAIANRRSRFVMLQENLSADPAVELFTNPAMRAGPPLPLVRRVLSAFAEVHARYHDLPVAERDRRLPLRRHPFLGPAGRELSRFVNLQAIDPCRRKQPAIFGAAEAALYRRAMQRWDELLERWYAGPLTLLHGDSHIGNVFVDGERIGMLDFQAAHWGKGVRDVQYFLINSLPEAVLAPVERELLAWYVQELGRHGVALDAAQAWEQYRAFAFQTLMTIVVSLGLGPLTEGEALMNEILARAVAAVQRVDFAGWLDARA